MDIDIIFEHQSNKLSGSLHTPSNFKSSTAIVMSHGSGPADRDNDIFFPPIRNFFLRQGLAVLCYDKPGVGGSTGNWKQQSFQDRASEVLAAVDFLKRTDSHKFQNIGLFGHSQGGWVVFLAASQSNAIDFVISNSGPAISPAEQDKFGLRSTNQQNGLPEAAIQQALELHEQLVDGAKKELPFDQVSNLIKSRTNLAWESYFSFDSDSWDFFKKVFNYDPIPALRSTQCPSLILLGEQDLLVPAQHCYPIFQANLTESDHRIHLFPDADHRMKVGEDRRFTADYFNVIRSWLTEHNIPERKSSRVRLKP